MQRAVVRALTRSRCHCLCSSLSSLCCTAHARPGAQPAASARQPHLPDDASSDYALTSPGHITNNTNCNNGAATVQGMHLTGGGPAGAGAPSAFASSVRMRRAHAMQISQCRHAVK